MEYSWDSCNPLTNTTEEEEEEQESLDNADVKKIRTLPENVLTTSLKKLLSIAKLKIDSNPNVMKCSCGHVCGSKGNPVFKKPSSSKVVKKNQGSHEVIIDSLFIILI